MRTAGATAWYVRNHSANNADVLTLCRNEDLRQVQLAVNGSELITQMLVKEGEQVKKGQMLATQDTDKLTHSFNMQQVQMAS